MVDLYNSKRDRFPLRVLHLITWLNRGGVETWLMSMLREIPRDVCAMDVCCKGPNVGELADEARNLGATVFHCPLDIAHIRFGRRLAEILRDEDYDIVHNHLNAYSGFPVWVARKALKPVITTFHCTQFRPESTALTYPFIRHVRSLYERFSVRYAVHKSDCVTGVSESVVGRFLPTHKGASDISRVLHYGVRIATPSRPDERNEFRQALGWPAGTPVVLHAGSFIAQKNHAGVITIFERVLQHIPEAKLILAGDGPLRKKIELLVGSRGIDARVKFLGVQEDIPKLMTMCDVLLFPSFFEGLSLVLLEAGGAGLPIVASNIPENAEAVDNGITGLLHDLHDVGGMAQSVERLLSDREYAQRLGQSGRFKVEQRFSVRAGAGRLLSLYEKCLHLPQGYLGEQQLP